MPPDTAAVSAESTAPALSQTAWRDHVFNDDLLINDGDLRFVQEQFPRVWHVLDNPKLRTEFVKYEKIANDARDRLRLYGFTAVVASTVALITLGTEPIWQANSSPPWISVVAVVVEFAGMFAGISAAGGLWLGRHKRRWLEGRLMTERLRQWHFQLLVRRGQEIEDSCKGTSELDKFRSERDLWLAAFLRSYEGKLDAELESAIKDPLSSFAWLHPPATPYCADSQVLRDVFDAYDLLRFKHQRSYASSRLKVTTDQPFWSFLKWPLQVQNTALSGAFSFCFVCALVCSGILIWMNVFHFGKEEGPVFYVRIAAIVIALLGFAMRTIHEGLGINEGIERYRDYYEWISELHEDFRNASDGKERLESMEELEVTSVEEMKAFLRTHQRAKFVL